MDKPHHCLAIRPVVFGQQLGIYYYGPFSSKQEALDFLLSMMEYVQKNGVILVSVFLEDEKMPHELKCHILQGHLEPQKFAEFLAEKILNDVKTMMFLKKMGIFI